MTLDPCLFHAPVLVARYRSSSKLPPATFPSESLLSLYLLATSTFASPIEPQIQDTVRSDQQIPQPPSLYHYPDLYRVRAAQLTETARWHNAKHDDQISVSNPNVDYTALVGVGNPPTDYILLGAAGRPNT